MIMVMITDCHNENYDCKTIVKMLQTMMIMVTDRNYNGDTSNR